MLVNDKNLKNRRKKIMKRLTIKKLIVISQSESRSLEVPFENGLNIIWEEIKQANLQLSKVYLLL